MTRLHIDPTLETEGSTQMLHGSWHSDAGYRLRYLNLRNANGLDHLSGYVTPETFEHVMRTLVSAEYGTPNWCEKCVGIEGISYCRCEVASNE